MWVFIKDPQIKSDLLSLIYIVENWSYRLWNKPLEQSNLFNCLLISWENIISSGTHKRAWRASVCVGDAPYCANTEETVYGDSHSMGNFSDPKNCPLVIFSWISRHLTFIWTASGPYMHRWPEDTWRNFQLNPYYSSKCNTKNQLMAYLVYGKWGASYTPI